MKTVFKLLDSECQITRLKDLKLLYNNIHSWLCRVEWRQCSSCWTLSVRSLGSRASSFSTIIFTPDCAGWSEDCVQAVGLWVSDHSIVIIFTPDCAGWSEDCVQAVGHVSVRSLGCRASSFSIIIFTPDCAGWSEDCVQAVGFWVSDHSPAGPQASL